MNPVTLRRIAIVGAILTVLVALDGLYMVLANYKPADTSNNGFLSFHPSDGQTVLIAAGLLLVITAIAFILSSRAQPKVESPVKQEVEPGAKA